MIELAAPVTRDGVTISSVRLFEPRASDILAITLAEKEPGGEIAATLRTIERLTDLPEWAIEQLGQDDLAAVAAACDAAFRQGAVN